MRLECFNCGRHDHTTQECPLPAHPSREQRKRAEFIAEDLVDACETLLDSTIMQWQDAGPGREARQRIVDFVKYVRTGESKQSMFNDMLRKAPK